MATRELELSHLPQAADPPPRGPLGTLWEALLGPFRKGQMPPPHPETGFFTDTTVCIGCKACEVACKEWNQLPADGFNWTGNSYDNTAELSASSWRHVKFIEQFPGAEPAGGARIPLPTTSTEPTVGRWLMMSDVCKHCVEAPCQQACPTGALIHNEMNNVYVQPDICNGCAYCIAACPFGVLTRSLKDGHAHKCTLCYDRQKDGLVPACAKACPTGSIQFGPLEELRQRARHRVDDLRRRGVPAAYLYGNESTADYSALNSFYLLVDRPAVYGLPDAPFNPWRRMKGDYLRAVAAALVGLAALLVLFLWMGH